MNYAWNTENIWKHFHDHQGKFVYCCAFNHSFAQNIRSSFFKSRFFLFKELSKIFKDFSGNFKDFSRISNNFSIQGLFKDMTLFQGLFRARVNHVSVNIKNNAEKDMTFFFSKSPGPSKLNLELHLGCHTCWLSCFLLVCLWFRQADVWSRNYQNLLDA